MEVERRRRRDRDARGDGRRAHGILVVDDDPDVPVTSEGCVRVAWSATNWSPMSMNAIDELRPRRVSSPNRRSQKASASSIEPTSSATWFRPTRRPTAASLDCGNLAARCGVAQASRQGASHAQARGCTRRRRRPRPGRSARRRLGDGQAQLHAAGNPRRRAVGREPDRPPARRRRRSPTSSRTCGSRRARSPASSSRARRRRSASIAPASCSRAPACGSGRSGTASAGPTRTSRSRSRAQRSRSRRDVAESIGLPRHLMWLVAAAPQLRRRQPTPSGNAPAGGLRYWRIAAQ